MKILSVDDKAENLYMLEALFRGHGHEVDSASDGAEALRLAQNGAYDLIVSDILMPRMDGFQLCREVKRDPRLHDIPFLFYTATYTDPKDAAFALALGAERFLIKPMEPEQFVKEVNETIAECATRAHAAATEEPEDEAIYLKEYNARLIAKLEKKMLDLEAANRALREDIVERERQGAERARLERQLRQAQRLEALGTLAGGIAHDFNNILSSILGFADMGHEECEPGDLNKKLYSEIIRSTTRGRGLTQQIMAFSRQADDTRETVDFSSAIAEAVSLSRPLLPAAVEVRTEIAGRVPPILANATQLHQILSNLLQNAGHAIGAGGGTITIRASDFAADETSAQAVPGLHPGRYTRLSVADTGQGIDEKTLERIFDPFFTTKPFGEGTGLGLSVVHGLMKTYDGAIAVESAPGRGATFHLYFPAQTGPGTVQPETSATVPAGHGERVLVLDGDATIARGTGRSLERLGYRPTVFTETQPALLAFRRGEFDLVITDLTMREATGIEVAREMWDERPGAPVVLMSGHSAALNVAQARALGFRDLLHKPFTLLELGTCLHQILAPQPVA